MFKGVEVFHDLEKFIYLFFVLFFCVTGITVMGDMFLCHVKHVQMLKIQLYE